jgi:hypothetical protein
MMMCLASAYQVPSLQELDPIRSMLNVFGRVWIDDDGVLQTSS